MGIYGMGNGPVLPQNLQVQHQGFTALFSKRPQHWGIGIIGGIFWADAGSHPLNYTRAFDYSTCANIICLGVTGLILTLLPKNNNDVNELRITE